MVMEERTVSLNHSMLQTSAWTDREILIDSLQFLIPLFRIRFTAPLAMVSRPEIVWMPFPFTSQRRREHFPIHRGGHEPVKTGSNQAVLLSRSRADILTNTGNPCVTGSLENEPSYRLGIWTKLLFYIDNTEFGDGHLENEMRCRFEILQATSAKPVTQGTERHVGSYHFITARVRSSGLGRDDVTRQIRLHDACSTRVEQAHFRYSDSATWDCRPDMGQRQGQEEQQSLDGVIPFSEDLDPCEIGSVEAVCEGSEKQAKVLSVGPARQCLG
ncbi:hypothetical protein J6590_040352 [Homalodisca vitripennis]|nr:hypothetical protein J6590_040352 [Homalodisca vitripennis]